MIAKKYRLKEREVKKVLRKGKPFFSYTIVCNRLKTPSPGSRFAIVLGKKSIPNNVIRNMYRRIFYRETAKYTEKNL